MTKSKTKRLTQEQIEQRDEEIRSSCMFIEGEDNPSLHSNGTVAVTPFGHASSRGKRKTNESVEEQD